VELARVLDRQVPCAERDLGASHYLTLRLKFDQASVVQWMGNDRRAHDLLQDVLAVTDRNHFRRDAMLNFFPKVKLASVLQTLGAWSASIRTMQAALDMCDMCPKLAGFQAPNREAFAAKKPHLEQLAALAHTVENRTVRTILRVVEHAKTLSKAAELLAVPARGYKRIYYGTICAGAPGTNTSKRRRKILPCMRCNLTKTLV
jgi:hypothetical protein